MCSAVRESHQALAISRHETPFDAGSEGFPEG
jgi:hypothetical protein